jgi:putative lipoic acid-binding regulatory protein
MSTESTLITFPCDFPIRVIGKNHPDFPLAITDIIVSHFPDFNKKTLSQKPSNLGQYLALRFDVHAENKPSLDALYQALTKHPDVKMVL